MKLQDAITRFPTKRDFDELFEKGKKINEVYTTVEVCEELEINYDSSGFLRGKIKKMAGEGCSIQLGNKKWIFGHKDLIKRISEL